MFRRKEMCWQLIILYAASCSLQSDPVNPSKLIIWFSIMAIKSLDVTDFSSRAVESLCFTPL